MIINKGQKHFVLYHWLSFAFGSFYWNMWQNDHLNFIHSLLRLANFNFNSCGHLEEEDGMFVHKGPLVIYVNRYSEWITLKENYHKLVHVMSNSQAFMFAPLISTSIHSFIHPSIHPWYCVRLFPNNRYTLPICLSQVDWQSPWQEGVLQLIFNIFINLLIFLKGG